MIDKIKIEKLVKEYITGTDLFIVAVRISNSGKITVLADKKEGITIEECVGMSRFIEMNLNRDEEDYELQVSSPGLDMPFLVLEQYYKNTGRMVEVVDSEGRKYSGVLTNVTSGGFELETEIKSEKKGKETPAVPEYLSFSYDQVKSAKEIVTFK